MSRYYFDFENGSNSNNGLSKDSAFKDFGVIDSLEFVAGDKILLKNGSRFTTPLLIKNSGSEEEPIVNLSEKEPIKKGEKSAIASVSFVPSVVGLIMSGEIIKDIALNK